MKDVHYVGWRMPCFVILRRRRAGCDWRKKEAEAKWRMNVGRRRVAAAKGVLAGGVALADSPIESDRPQTSKSEKFQPAGMQTDRTHERGRFEKARREPFEREKWSLYASKAPPLSLPALAPPSKPGRRKTQRKGLTIETARQAGGGRTRELGKKD